PDQHLDAGRLAGETDHDTIRAIALDESFSACGHAGASGAEPLSPCSQFARVKRKLGSITATASPKRDWRAATRTDDSFDRRLAGDARARNHCGEERVGWASLCCS